MNKLSLGTRVRLSDVGRGRYENEECNPHDQVGTVFENNYDGEGEDGMCYHVLWTGGRTNSYYLTDLKAIPMLEENE